MAVDKLKQFWDSLTGKSVTFIILALIVTMSVVTVASILQGRNLLQAQVQEHLTITAKLVANRLDDKLRVRVNAVTDAARALRMPGDALLGSDSYAEPRIVALSELFDRVSLLDADGRLRADWPSSGRAGIDLSDTDYFRTTRDTLTTLISKPFVSEITGKPTVNISAPVFNQNRQLIGVLVGGMQLTGNILSGGVRNLKIGESGYIGVATRTGIALAHADSRQIMQPVPADNPAVQLALQGFEGATMAVNPQGQEALYQFRQLNEAPWIVGVIIPTEEAYAALSRFVHTTLWGSAILLLVLAAVSWRVFSNLLAPLGILAQQTVARHTGERNIPVSTRGGAEIRHVAESFNTVFEQRAQSLVQIQEREAFFRTLSENVPLGILQTDILGRVTFLNPAFTALTGIGLDEGLNKNWLDGLHPEDREGVRESWLSALDESRVFQSRFRIRNTTGSIRWVEVIATKIESSEAILGYIASVRDITIEHRIQELLEAERRRFKSILDTIAEGVVLTEQDGRIRYLNGPATRYLACPGPVAGESLFEQIEIEVEGQRQTAEALLQMARLENLDVTLSNRRKESWELELTMLRTEHAESEDQLVFVLRDDSERRRKEERLTWEATHDALTGLLNRRAFSSRLNDAIAQVDQGGAMAALVVIDLDGFKPVNDEAGHLTGDSLLRELATVMRQQVRQSDTVARLGGDEFAMILPGCNVARAVELAEAVRGAIADLRVEHEGRQYGVTASLGVALIRAGEDSSRTVIGRADRACYAAKAAGRNAVEVGD